MRKFIFLATLFLAFTVLAKLPHPSTAFKKLELNYRRMLNDKFRNKYRHHYVRHVRHFNTFNKIYENRYNPRLENAKFYIASIFTDLAFASGKTADFVVAYNKLSRFTTYTSKSTLISMAKNKMKRLEDYAKKKNIRQITEKLSEQKEFGKLLARGLSHLQNINIFKNSITLHTNKPVKYRIETRKRPRNKHYLIEIQNARLSFLKKNIKSIKTTHVKNLKFYQHTSKLVRIEFITDKNLFPLVTETKEGKKVNFAVRPWNIVNKAKQELFKKVKVLIDPGHGGSDPGGIKNSIKEKDLTLAISRNLGNLLKKENFDVHYTRTRDTTLSLNKRAEIARKIEPDVFISIHANSSRNSRVSGIETYYFDVKTDKITREIAARENQKSGPVSNLDFILEDLKLSKTFYDAGNLASKIHNSLIRGITRKYKKQRFRNRGTRGGPFFVLHNTNVPSILIETGFISNKREARRLRSKRYQVLLAKQITIGLKSFIKSKE